MILHAYRSGWDEVPRWVADVVLVLRSEGDTFAWDRFIERVFRGHLAAPVVEALRYLASEFGAPIPAAVLTRLAHEPTRRERHKHRVASRPVTTERDWLLGETRDLRTTWALASVNLTRQARRREHGRPVPPPADERRPGRGTPVYRGRPPRARRLTDRAVRTLQ